MRRQFIAFIAAIAFLSAGAQEIPSPMVPQRLVNDFAGIFDAGGLQEMEDSLVEFDKATSTQIAVVTVKDLGGYAPSDYALAIMREWGVGRKGKDNGIVLLIKPRNAYGRGQVYISVGTGLEGALNDAKAGRIIDQYMMDGLVSGDYTGAALKGTAALRSAVRGEFTMDEEYYSEDETGLVFAFIILLATIAIICIIASKSDRGSGYGGGGTFFPPVFFGRGRSFGGGFGGGFGGFGGGCGAGGGAGRSF